ncbi:molybdate ABC transporter substrate-binding protein [Streptomyces sp. NPDC006997]|uniref:molybdate ABC transporter substrate-binding protein n=1 Tax=Streptomyces sp. NPDC006997 TaxID=3155356 RepID=UPI00340873A7
MTIRSARRTRRGHRALTAGGIGGAALLLLGACSPAVDTQSGSDAHSAPAYTTSGQVSGTVTVLAAASLKESFTALAAEFEKRHPGTEVTLGFGGSDNLAASITSGAPADVFAAASPGTMETVVNADGTVGPPATFVRNQLEIATLPGNPDQITTLKDLGKSGLKVVLCDATVPCGIAAQRSLEAGGVSVTPVSYERDVKSALTKVELKEADAALVYRTDVRAAGGKVTGVPFPESAQAVNNYPIARLKDAPNAEGGQAFIDLVRSAEGRKILTDAGFLAP